MAASNPRSCDEIAALVGAARNSNCPATLDLGNLSHDGAHGPSRRGDDYGIARLRLARFEQAEICRHPRHAQYIEESWKRRYTGVDLDQPFPSEMKYS